MMPAKRECWWVIASSNVGEARCALVDDGADRLGLVGAPQQFLLLDGFGEQRRAGIDGQIVQHALGGTDGVGTLASDLACDLKGGGPRIVADPRRKAVTHRFPGGENPTRIGEFAQDIVAHEASEDWRSRHVRYQSPFDLHDRHSRVGRKETHVGAERELEAAAERDALDRGNHRHRKLPPAPHRLLREIGEPVGSDGKVALLPTRYPTTAAFLHGGEPAHVETGTKRAAFTGQYYRPQALFAGKPPGGRDQRLEHRGIERVHLVRPNQPNIGDPVRNRYRDALFHEMLPHSYSFAALQKGVVRI